MAKHNLVSLLFMDAEHRHLRTAAIHPRGIPIIRSSHHLNIFHTKSNKQPCLACSRPLSQSISPSSAPPHSLPDLAHPLAVPYKTCTPTLSNSPVLAVRALLTQRIAILPRTDRLSSHASLSRACDNRGPGIRRESPAPHHLPRIHGRLVKCRPAPSREVLLVQDPLGRSV